MNTTRAVPSSEQTLRACALLSFAYFTSIGAFNPYAPLWFKSLGLSPLVIGLLVSVQSWTRLFAPYLWGSLADRTGQRVLWIRRCAVACLLSACIFLLPPHVALLGLATFLMFFFNAAVVPLTETVVAAQLLTQGGGMDARRYGRVRVWGSIGFLSTVLLGGWWIEHLGLRSFVPSVLILLVLLVWAAWRVPLQAGAGSHAHEPAPPVREVLRRPAVAWFFASVFLTVMAHSSLYVFFSLYLDELGYSKPMVGAMWGIGVIVEILWFIFQGRIIERWSPHLWLVASGLFASLRFALTAAFASQLPVLVMSQCLHALTFAAQHTVCIALVSRYFPGRLRGRGQALYSVLGYGCSGVLGGLAGGSIAEHWGYGATFWAGSAVALLGALSGWRSLRLDRKD